MSTFDGLMVDRSNLARLSDAKTRSICSENRTGAKAGGARDVPPVDADGKPTGCARDLAWGTAEGEAIRAELRRRHSTD